MCVAESRGARLGVSDKASERVREGGEGGEGKEGRGRRGISEGVKWGGLAFRVLQTRTHTHTHTHTHTQAHNSALSCLALTLDGSRVATTRQ
jgi:hypothetical protein